LLDRRVSVAARYAQRLSRVRGVESLKPAADTRMSWFVYVVRFDSSISRDNVAARMSANGIPTRNYFPPIHLQPLYLERYGYKQGQFPVTERVSASALALPFHANLSEGDIGRVCDALEAAIDAGANFHGLG
jgi:perosamine synthetase